MLIRICLIVRHMDVAGKMVHGENDAIIIGMI